MNKDKTAKLKNAEEPNKVSDVNDVNDWDDWENFEDLEDFNYDSDNVNNNREVLDDDVQDLLDQIELMYQELECAEKTASIKNKK